ncbi:unnamed protein product [Orchesella dallaii]|uniref:Uncharacterized protein n=1 Tax=Orchesella dallaii TaxID=48710 RepID=A0ABP1S2Q5_9HEXA
MDCYKVVKTMKVNANLLSGFLFLLLIAESISALIPAPMAPAIDDLLGPGQCPTGSVCIETTYCTIEYVTTKAGLPFHCGPRYQIDSMVCCINNIEAETTDFTVENQGTPHTGEDIMNEMMNTNEIHSSERTNRTAEDDEVDILAVPFSTNQFDEHEVPLSDFDGHFDTWGDDLESLIEDAIEHENLKQNIRETEPALKDFLDEQREYIFPNNNMKDPLPVYVASRGQPGPPSRPSWEHPDSRAYESKPYPNPGLDRPNMNNCPCEKGERGEAGPKGEPGEPGQIIYIPVFVNAPGYPPMIPSGAPLSLNPSNPPNQPNVQTYYGHSNAPVPQHHNPTVVPYNVPINLAPTVPTQQQPQLAPQYYIQNQQQQPSSAPPADISLEARQTRHATNDPRYANRRY